MNSRFSLIIQPHDVLLFRDGKPFSAGSDTRARSLFPPTPFTIQGAIRARVLFAADVSLAEYYEQKTSKAQELLKLISAPDKGYGQLHLRGPFLARRENGGWVPYFPLPADVVKVGERYTLLQPLENPPWESNIPDNLNPLWVRTIDHAEGVWGWIDQKGLEDYLEGRVPWSTGATYGGDSSQKLLVESDLVEREYRFGIALERTRRTARESYLYLTEFLRLREEVAFWVEVEGIQRGCLGGDKGFLQLGGESRVAYYEVQNEGLNSLLSLPESLPERFKVVLLTPAWFSGGWAPQDLDWKKLFVSDVNDDKPVQLISAVIPRYQAIGGAYVSHQQTKGFQRPLRRFVPAGSVYFFESQGSVRLKGTAFTETPPDEGDYGQIGFGTCVIAEWEYA